MRLWFFLRSLRLEHDELIATSLACQALKYAVLVGVGNEELANSLGQCNFIVPRFACHLAYDANARSVETLNSIGIYKESRRAAIGGASRNHTVRCQCQQPLASCHNLMALRASS